MPGANSTWPAFLTELRSEAVETAVCVQRTGKAGLTRHATVSETPAVVAVN